MPEFRRRLRLAARLAWAALRGRLAVAMPLPPVEPPEEEQTSA